MGALHAAGVTSADVPLFQHNRSDCSGLRPTVIPNSDHDVIHSPTIDLVRNRLLCAIIPVIASKTPRCDRCARHVRPQPVSADRCSPCPRRGGLPSLITMVVSPPSVRRLASPVTRPTRRPLRSLVTSRPWRASRDRHRRRPSRHAAARPARTARDQAGRVRADVRHGVARSASHRHAPAGSRAGPAVSPSRSRWSSSPLSFPRRVARGAAAASFTPPSQRSPRVGGRCHPCRSSRGGHATDAPGGLVYENIAGRYEGEHPMLLGCPLAGPVPGLGSPPRRRRPRSADRQ